MKSNKKVSIKITNKEIGRPVKKMIVSQLWREEIRITFSVISNSIQFFIHTIQDIYKSVHMEMSNIHLSIYTVLLPLFG